MEQENFLSGGVSLLHKVVNGKHCYEVDKVLTSTPSDFGRKGDTLTMINDDETQYMPPRTFIRMLSSGSPLLTLHRASIDVSEANCPESECMKPYHKEKTVLCFSLAMIRKECLEEDEENPQVLPEWESGDEEGQFCNDEELLLVSMTDTNVATIQGRGCDAQNPCSSCGGTDCTLNSVAVATKQAMITSVGSEYIKKNFEKGDVLIQSLLQKNICPENISRIRRSRIRNCTTENITIYYYISNAQEDFDKGVPVVLNFTGSTNFLKCICDHCRPTLIVECCEKSKLGSIGKNDPDTWCFVFYLKSTKDDHRRFESAAYTGWFIHVKPNGMVCVDQGTNNMETNFYVFLHST